MSDFCYFTFGKALEKRKLLKNRGKTIYVKVIFKSCFYDRIKTTLEHIPTKTIEKISHWHKGIVEIKTSIGFGNL